MARKKNTPPEQMQTNPQMEGIPHQMEENRIPEEAKEKNPDQKTPEQMAKEPSQGDAPICERDADTPPECPADLTQEKETQDAPPAEAAPPAAVAPPTLTERIDRASHVLMDKFDESLYQLNRRAVQIKCHVVLEDKSTRDEITTRYEEDERVDLEAMDRLADTLKTIRQSAALKLPGEDNIRALPLLGLSDEEKEAYCK